MMVEDCIILCGEVLLIPVYEREKTLEAIDQGHLSFKCSSLCAYCTACILWKAGPFDLTPVPNCPWQMIVSHMLSFDGFK